MKKKANLKQLSLKKRIEYIWDYYKLHIIGGVFCIYLAVSLLSGIYKNSQIQLNVLMINTFSYLDYNADPFKEFLSSTGHKVTENSVVFEDLLFTGDESYDYQTSQKFMVLLASGGSEIIFGNGELFDSCVEQGAFMDLRDILSNELLERYSEDLLYCETEDGTRYPCAVSLTNSPWVLKYPEYKDCCYGIPYRSEHEETAFSLANYLLQ
jgi:hypothetical protein